MEEHRVSASETTNRHVDVSLALVNDSRKNIRREISDRGFDEVCNAPVVVLADWALPAALPHLVQRDEVSVPGLSPLPVLVGFPWGGIFWKQAAGWSLI